jgi:hypothetical protein
MHSMVLASIQTKHIIPFNHIATPVGKYSITSSEISSAGPFGNVKPHDAGTR